MTKAKISEYDAVASNNTDVNGVNIAEGCPPSGMNNMGREIMAALKRFQVGSDGDGVTVGGNLVVSGSVEGGLVVNDSGADVDFRVESDTEPNALFVDGATGNVGIGTTAALTWSGITSGSLQTARTTFNPVIASTFAASTAYPALIFGKSRSATVGTYTYPSSGDRLGRIGFAGASTDDAQFNDAAVIESVATQTWTSTAQGAYLRFFTTADDTKSTTERMRLTSDGYLRMSASSGGIQFGGDTAAANALDDYEEGTWTPVLADASSGGNASPTSATNANYTKIGNLVNVQCQFTNIDTTGMTGAATIWIRNFPFSAASVAGTLLLPGSIILQVVTFSGYVAPYIVDGASYGSFRQSSSGLTSSSLTVGDFSSGVADLWMSLTYQAA